MTWVACTLIHFYHMFYDVLIWSEFLYNQLKLSRIARWNF